MKPPRTHQQGSLIWPKIGGPRSSAEGPQPLCDREQTWSDGYSHQDAGHNSRIGRLINRKSAIGAKLSKTDYLAVMTGLMELMAREGLVSLVEIEADLHGWRLSPSAVRLIPGEAIRSGTAQGNRYFHDLYSTIAADLKGGKARTGGWKAASIRLRSRKGSGNGGNGDSVSRMTIA